MCNKSRIKIAIQSFSDIITNSSSELFCKIRGNNLEEIEDILNHIFADSDTEAELVDWDTTETYEEVKCNPYVRFYLGYHCGVQDNDVVKLVIESVLNNKIGKDNYTIEY